MCLAVTPGEPAGIGPDLVVQLAQEELPFQLVVVADPALMQQRAAQLQLPLTVLPYDPHRAAPVRAAAMMVDAVSLRAPVAPGRPDPRNAAYVLDTLRQAVKRVAERQAAALVTGPVHKAVINEAGLSFIGHTEFLAELTMAPLPVMMLVAGPLRVALVTTHLPLRAVPDAVTPERIRQTLEVLHGDLQRRFGIRRPMILVAGLNPHAGEDGYLGREEIEVLQPVLKELRARGLNVVGPIPADTLFTPDRLHGADAVLAMYHDQGLPALKYAGFGEAVNVTLGLPIIRTSVDHGTALELAGTGRARNTSFRAALALAAELAGRA